jgi:DNA-binding transcriptional LysR family regulator
VITSDLDPSRFVAQALRRLRLRHVELLAVLGTVPTVHSAADKLNLSQPAVSKMIKEIENVTQAPLFERSKRGLSATPRGAMMVRFAHSIIRHLQGAGDQLDAMKEGMSGLLRLGSSSMLTYLPRVILRVHQALPDLRVRVTEGRPRDLLAQLLAGELDCAITALPPALVAQSSWHSLLMESLAKDTLCVVASRGHRLASRRKLTWPELAGERWVLSQPDSLTREEFTSRFIQEGLRPPTPVVESLSAPAIVDLVGMDGELLGLVRLHQALAIGAKDRTVRLRVSPEISMPDISLVVNTLSPVPKETMDLLRTMLRLSTPNQDELGGIAARPRKIKR